MATTISPRRIRGCFDTIEKLYFIASIAFTSLKMIRGIVNIVKKEIATRLLVPQEKSHIF
jgi:hypothetical protein